VAKGSLDVALQSDEVRSNCDVEVRWHPFFIRPNMVDQPQFKDGVTPGSSGTPGGAYWHWAIDKAKKYGLDMSGGIDKFPDVIYGHRLLYWAEKQGGWQIQHDLSGRIFKAFYSDCVFLGPENLARLAGEAGLDADAALAYMRSDTDTAKVKDEARRYSQGGVSGVPNFIINGKPAFSGSQEPRTFASAIVSA